MEDLKQVMRENYLQYASYVILDRAIPNVIDGLKPVQRRILHTLRTMHDGKFHKVANVAGQTMAYHPHGDAAITDALVNLANKEYFLDQQGNFGNLFTGDPAAASRYIETRLSPLAIETLFNADLTSYVPSYDGRNKEPICLPARIPVLLMQGADGIAVGMSTRILPHNFCELLEAQIAILEGRPFTLLPDFQTGGLMDASDYQKGRGKVKLRTKIEIKDKKTLVIREICYSTTTESLIRSIDEAAKRGKIKLESINDYTSEAPEIELILPRGHYAEEAIPALYAYTECEVSLSSQMVVIKDNLPWETDVEEILRLNTEFLEDSLKRELEIERERLLEKIFHKTLEQIFIENRLYKKIETIKEYEVIHTTIAKSLEPYQLELLRVPSHEDREHLLQIPIRRISQFDIDKHRDMIAEMVARLEEIAKTLKQMKAFTVKYLKGLLKKFGESYPRRTMIEQIEEIDRRAIEQHDISVGIDAKEGFVGTKVKDGTTLTCSNFDKLLLLYKDGSYQVINIPEKLYVGEDGRKLAFVGVADKKTIMNVVYHNKKTKFPYAKRFVINKFILDKLYRFIEADDVLDQLTTASDSAVTIEFVPKPRQKVGRQTFTFENIPVKGVTAKGIRLANKECWKVRATTGEAPA